MHEQHGDIHETGIQDNCAACTELADNPYSNMDHVMLHNLIIRNYNYRFNTSLDVDERFKWAPRSTAEAIAMVNITNVIEKMGKLFETAPDIMTLYLASRWRIDFQELV